MLVFLQYTTAVPKSYVDQNINKINYKTNDENNVFKYLNNTNQTSSERNMTANSFGVWTNSPCKYYDKAYDVTLEQHAPPNHYNSITGFNLYSAGVGKFTLVFEFHTTEMSNVIITSISNTATINKQTQTNLIDYIKVTTQVNNPSLQNPDYLYQRIIGNSTQATIKAHIIIYGVRGWVDSVDSSVYDYVFYYLDEMFEYDNGDMKIKTDIDMSNKKITNLKTPTVDTDAASKSYIDETLSAGHLVASSKTNEFIYLDNPDDTSSEYNIAVNGFTDFNQSPHRNKKAYSITLEKDSGENNYRSRIGFNLYPLPLGTYTMIFEFYPPEMTNIQLSCQATSAYIHKQVQKDFSNYSKMLVQINNNSKNTPDYIYLTIHGTAVRSPVNAHLIVYGIKECNT